MSSRATNVTALSIGLLAVSVSAILIRLCASAPTAIAFWRLLAAGLVFVLWTAFRGKGGIDRHDFRLSVLAALFLAAHFYLWISALFMTSINSSVVLLAMQPLFALILQFIFHKIGASRRNFISLSAGIFGAAILAHGDFLRGGIAGTGDIFAILAALMGTCYLFVGSYRRGPLIPYLGSVYLQGAVFIGIAAMVRGDSLLAVRPVDWFWFALLALVPTLIGHTMLNRSAKYFAPYVLNLSFLVEPLLTGGLAYLVFSEIPTGNILVGAVFIVGAVVVEVLGEKRNDKWEMTNDKT